MINTSREITLSTILLLLTFYIQAQQESTQSKELTISKPLAAGSRVIIDQLDRKLIIKASQDNTIKLVTTVFYKGKNSVTDAEWWDYLNIEVKELTGLISVQAIRVYVNKMDQKTRDPAPTGIDFDPRTGVGTGIAQFDSTGRWVNRKSNIRRELVIYLPASSHLQVENRFGDIAIETGLEEVNAVVDHSSLTMPDITKLTLRSSYGHITSGNIREANINITGGKWSVKKADKLNIVSRSSSVDIGSTQDATINSGDDQYDIDEIKSIHGTKNFGELRVLQLTGSMDITGNSAQIKIRNLTESVSLIKIDDQFTDLKLPLNNLKNYSIDFQGTTSKVYAPFELPASKEKFTTTSGDTKAAHTSLQLKCSNCTVEFQ